MKSARIGFVGGGNMASSIIGGLMSRGWPAARIRVSDPVEAIREQYAQRGIGVSASNEEAVRDCEVVVLAVKPQHMREACAGVSRGLAKGETLVISIAAGIGTEALRRWLGEGVALVRCMPNTPALLQCGATALYATPDTGSAQRELAGEILQSVGLAVWVATEELLDTVTALSGSGPAYFFLVMEMMQKSAQRLGLDARLSRDLCLQTALGAARMAIESGMDVDELRRRVTSPGGTTERAVAIMQQQGMARIFDEALEAAALRSAQLGRELAGD